MLAGASPEKKKKKNILWCPELPVFLTQTLYPTWEYKSTTTGIVHASLLGLVPNTKRVCSMHRHGSGNTPVYPVRGSQGVSRTMPFVTFVATTVTVVAMALQPTTYDRDGQKPCKSVRGSPFLYHDRTHGTSVFLVDGCTSVASWSNDPT